MIKYSIEKNETEFSDFAYILNRNGNKIIVRDDSSLRQVMKDLSKVINSGNYEILINKEYMTIKVNGTDSKYIFKDWLNICDMNIFRYIRGPINKRIESGKFIDTSNVDKLKRKPIRHSKFNKATVIKVALVGIFGSVTLSTVGSIQEIEDVPKTETVTVTVLEEPTKEEPAIEKPIISAPIPTIEFGFDDLSSTVKAKNTKKNYYSLIEKYSRLYGLDPELVLGIATQERGVHATQIDEGGGIGLMQIQYNVWLNKWLRYYKLNEETGNYDYFSSEITDERMRNLESNIEIGCRILQWCIINADYNLPIAIQMYNMGYGTMNKVIEQYGNATGKTREQIINNPMDLGWMEYCKNFPGDPNYLENVNSWIFDNTFVITNVFDKSQIALRFTNENERTMKI